MTEQSEPAAKGPTPNEAGPEMSPAEHEAELDVLRCSSCAAEVSATDLFCEGCGTDLIRPSSTTSGSVVAASAPAAAPAPDPAAGAEPTGGVPRDPVEGEGAGDELFGDAKTHQLALTTPIEPLPRQNAFAGEADPTARPCGACGGAVASDGYCTMCGARAESERDHWEEVPASWVAGVCDRGVRHHKNEDAMALAADEEPGSHAVLVVCDGVSSAPNSDEASKAATLAARDHLMAAFAASPDAPADRAAYWTAETEAAVAGAREQVLEATAALGAAESGNPPSCTYVSAVVHLPVVVIGWTGDSRAYWFPDDGVATQVTIDDSWVTDQVARGVPRAVAEADSRAHSITRWLGADTDDWRPRCAVLRPEATGWLLLCSDGLWNYCSDATALRALLIGIAGDRSTTTRPIVDIAGELVAWANQQGGHDNITVALARLPGPVGASTGDEPAPVEATTPDDSTQPTQPIQPPPAQPTEEGAHDG